MVKLLPFIAVLIMVIVVAICISCTFSLTTVDSKGNAPIAIEEEQTPQNKVDTTVPISPL